MTRTARESELEMQQALAQFLTDPAARRAVLADTPNGPGSWCTPDVRKRLRALDNERTTMFSQILVGNRMSKVMEGLPWTSWAIGARLVGIVEEYNQNCPLRHPKKYGEAMCFAAFMESKLRTSPTTPPWLYDVLRYERTVLRLRYVRDPHLVDIARTVFPFDNVEDMCPRRTASADVLTFDYDIEEIAVAFEHKLPPPDLTPQPTILLLQGMVNGSVNQDKINLATAEFLNACVDDRKLAEVISSVASQLGLPFDGIQAGCLELCAELVNRGVLTLR